jgi:hypothetical protein
MSLAQPRIDSNLQQCFPSRLAYSTAIDYNHHYSRIHQPGARLTTWVTRSSVCTDRYLVFTRTDLSVNGAGGQGTLGCCPAADTS